jgi:hypothetical protein
VKEITKETRSLRPSTEQQNQAEKFTSSIKMAGTSQSWEEAPLDTLGNSRAKGGNLIMEQRR